MVKCYRYGTFMKIQFPTISIFCFSLEDYVIIAYEGVIQHLHFSWFPFPLTLLSNISLNSQSCLKICPNPSFPVKVISPLLSLLQESRAAARKPRDAASVLFGQSSPTAFLTSIRLAMLRKPRFRAPMGVPRRQPHRRQA